MTRQKSRLTNLAQFFFRVLAQTRRGTLGRRRRAVDQDRRTDDAGLTTFVPIGAIA
jgi:hypothetical protein